ncbi:MAG: hypothetical protein A2Y25_09275 [Candidatus Melainabacteria bacterium GWF2_37_15]|nr:MAG: hypothetical protein A2Y25_09275 [Candidatus Melainabacteria bacterium GWF2_37_15]
MLLIACIKLVIIFVSSFFLSLSGEIEKNIIYKPSKTLSPLILNAEIHDFSTPNNLKLSYLHIKGNKKSPIIIFCHGNEGNVTLEKLQKKLVFLEKKGYEVYALDYRGYGKSDGSPDERGIYSDVRSFIKYLNLKPENIVIWGHSLGAAIVIDTAKDINFKGVITEGGFTSVEDMRDYRIKNDDLGDPVSNFTRDFIYNSLTITQKFNSKAKVSLIKSPMLILHGKKDTIVPYEMGITLSKLNKNAELFLSETGDHNDTGWQDAAVLEFIENL